MDFASESAAAMTHKNSHALNTPMTSTATATTASGETYSIQVEVMEDGSFSIPASEVVGVPVASEVFGVPVASEVVGVPVASEVVGVPAASEDWGIPQEVLSFIRENELCGAQEQEPAPPQCGNSTEV